MKIHIKNPSDNAATLLRRAGYAFQRRDGEELSFVRTFGRADFPRFHCYARETAGETLLSIHLDVRRETYGEGTRHHGEYANEGPLQDEARRLLLILGPSAELQ